MERKEVFCPNCGNMRAYTVVNKPQTFTVKGEEIEVKADAAICAGCGEVVFHAELDAAALRTAYNEYRKRHGLLFPSDIKAIREKYGLSQRALARLLRWGEVTVQRYEAGALQDQAHNDLLVLLQDPENMKKLLEKERGRLSPREVARIEARLDNLLDNEALPEFLSRLIGGESSIFTGFRPFSFSRFAQVVSYFARACSPLYKTKLLKLLWYSDFLAFKRLTLSLTGAKYVHYPLGPVPQYYELLLGAMEGKTIEIIPTMVYDHYGEEILPKEDFDPEVFSHEELDVLRTVEAALAHLTAGEISARSHEEAPYKLTGDKEVISYEYAGALTLA